MKALLRKDFLVLSTSFRRVLVIWLIFPLVAMINPSMSYFALYIGLVAGTLSTSLINLEEKENWNTFAGSLPISKKDVVTERYLFTLLMVAAATLIGAICYCSYLVRGLNEFANPTIILSNFAYSLLLPALTLPATYRFGVEKARYIVMVVVLLLTLLSTFLTSVPARSAIPYSLLFFLGISTVFYISYLISVKWYSDKN